MSAAVAEGPNDRCATALATTYASGTEFMAVAHRGGAALGPENTEEAFQRALDMGYRYLETDVRMTRDGVCVAFHDRSLRRVTGTAGTIDAVTLGQVQQLRVLGRGRVPRLDGLLHAWPDAQWMLDIKQPDAVPALVEVIRAAGAAHRVCLGGTWDRVLAQAHDRLGPQLTTALGWRSLTSLVTGTSQRPGSATFAHLPLKLGAQRLPTPRVLERARARGLRVVVWGAETTTEMQQLINDGVDGVITDRTDLLREVLIARGNWRTPGTRAATPRTSGLDEDG